MTDTKVETPTVTREQLLAGIVAVHAIGCHVGAGRKMSTLIKSPDELRNDLIKKIDAYVAQELTARTAELEEARKRIGELESGAHVAVGKKLMYLREVDSRDIPSPVDLESCDLFTIDEFAEMLEAGGIIPYDGTGHFAKDGLEHKNSSPSFYAKTLKQQAQTFGWTHVVWYNR